MVPAFYSINDAAGHIVTRVHHSRVVRFIGRELPELERQAELYWGESEVEALYKDVVAHDNVSANMAALTFQANINTMEVKGLEQLLSLSSPDVQRLFLLPGQKVHLLFPPPLGTPPACHPTGLPTLRLSAPAD